MQQMLVADGRGFRWFARALPGLVFALLFSASAALAAAPMPSWKVTGIATPTNFSADEIGSGEAGPAYLFEATNVGGAATGGVVTLQAALPSGVLPTSVRGGDDDVGAPAPGCTISAQVVTCTTPGPIQPGRSVSATIVVDTEPGLAGTVVAEATAAGGGSAPASVSVETRITPETPGFDFLPAPTGFSGALTEADGVAAGSAGSHPFQLTVNFGFPSRRTATRLLNSGQPRDLEIDLPRGFIVNPTATPALCTEAQLAAASCPPASQVGIVTMITSVIVPEANASPLYNMVPPPGSSSNFAFDAGGIGIPVHLLGSVQAGDYGLSAATRDLFGKFPIFDMGLQLWGDPSSPSHDAARGASVPAQNRSLLSLPGACGPMSMTARVDSWDEPGVFVTRSIATTGLDGEPLVVSGCGELAFAPDVEIRPTTDVADSPSGLAIDLITPQNEGPGTRASAQLRRAEFLLPKGLVANPSGANGLEGCSPAQVGLTSTVGVDAVRFDDEPARCPDASRIGTARINTPLLDHLVQGSVYLATPDENPFRSLLAVYIVVEDFESGITLKLAGRVDADPATGRLRASFDQLPQLPIADIVLRFFAGATAPLRTPPTCGTYMTTSMLTPWSELESATPSDSYAINRAPDAARCPDSEADLPAALSFDAATASPAAGAAAPFAIELKRGDGTQQIVSATAVLPEGLSAGLAGVSYCPEAALAAAATRPAGAEHADPSCPRASRVGSVTVGVGAGPKPYYIEGDAYLAGPYGGAPFSLAVVIPADAGPFDLGTVVLRVALGVDPRTAQVSAVSDSIPLIVGGIPLDLRLLQLKLDRPGFIRNPTSCEPMAVDLRVASPAGQSALSAKMQTGGCRQLGFQPRVSVRLLGPTHRGAHPGLRTVVSARRGDADLRRFALTLPATELLDSKRIAGICSAPQRAAERCPASSLVGRLEAWSPLLERPLEGPVYLSASKTRLPRLDAFLHGQVDLVLSGRIDSVHGHLRTTFQALPDVPLTKAVLTLQGGSRGILVNTGGLCARERRVSASLLAHSGRLRNAGPVLGTGCLKAGRKRLSPEGNAR